MSDRYQRLMRVTVANGYAPNEVRKAKEALKKIKPEKAERVQDSKFMSVSTSDDWGYIILGVTANVVISGLYVAAWMASAGERWGRKKAL